MGEKKPPGHYCGVCGRRQANERFGGRGHAQHICKDCQRELKQATRQKRKAIEADDEILDSLSDDGAAGAGAQ